MLNVLMIEAAVTGALAIIALVIFAAGMGFGFVTTLRKLASERREKTAQAERDRVFMDKDRENPFK